MEITSTYRVTGSDIINGVLLAATTVGVCAAVDRYTNDHEWRENLHRGLRNFGDRLFGRRREEAANAH